MVTAQLETVPSSAAFPAEAPNTVPFGTTLIHTWYLTGRKLHALVRQPWVLAFSVVQPVVWLFLFGELFRSVIRIPGFAYDGTYLAYLVPGLIAMNAMSNNMWAGMGMIEEIDRGTLNRFLAAPASRVGIMNATVAEQAVSTTVQSLIIVGLGLAGGARYHGGVAGVAVMVAASILVGVVFGALSNATGMLLRSREAIIGVYTFFMLPLMFLSSAFMQTRLMPGWMQAIAACNPLNWAVQIGRSAVSAHPDWGAIGIRCGGLLVLAVACVAVSVVTFRSYQKNVLVRSTGRPVRRVRGPRRTGHYRSLITQADYPRGLPEGITRGRLPVRRPSPQEPGAGRGRHCAWCGCRGGSAPARTLR